MAEKKPTKSAKPVADRPMTAKQERFVREYLIDLNATQAAIRAGYSPRSAEVEGHRLLRNAKVAASVSANARRHAAKADVSAQDVINGLYLEATREGEGASHGARVSAWVALGKYHKLFVDRIEADVSADVMVTDARGQLESVIARQLAARGKASGT